MQKLSRNLIQRPIRPKSQRKLKFNQILMWNLSRLKSQMSLKPSLNLILNLHLQINRKRLNHSRNLMQRSNQQKSPSIQNQSRNRMQSLIRQKSLKMLIRLSQSQNKRKSQPKSLKIKKNRLNLKYSPIQLRSKMTQKCNFKLTKKLRTSILHRSK